MSGISVDTRLRRETQLAVVNFGKATRVILDFTEIRNTRNTILNLNKKLRSKMADLGSAFKTIREDMLKDGTHDSDTHIIVISDKNVDTGLWDYEQEAMLLQRRGIIIHGLSISQRPKIDLAKVVTSSDSGMYLQMVDSYGDLKLESKRNELISSLLTGELIALERTFFLF